MDEYSQDSLVQVKPKIYTKRAIEIGTFVGGPFVAGYLISKNYTAFNQPDKAKRALVIGTMCTIVLAVILFLVPEGIVNKIPNHLIPFINGAIAYLVVRKFQGTQIEECLKSGGEKASAWKVAGISLIGVLIFLIPFFFVLIFQPSVQSGDVMTFGNLEHQIFYDKSNISANKVKAFGEEFTKIGVFGNRRKMQLHLKESNTVYEFSCPVQNDAWNDSRVINSFQWVRDTLQSFCPDKIVVINLAYENFDSVRLTIVQGVPVKPKTIP